MNNNILCANLSLIPEFNSIVKGENSVNILKLNKVNCTSSKSQDGSTYTVIRYDKQILSVDLIETYGLCRSVILNSDNDCFTIITPT